LQCFLSHESHIYIYMYICVCVYIYVYNICSVLSEIRMHSMCSWKHYFLFTQTQYLLSCFVKFVCLSEVIWHIHVYCRRTWHSLVLEVHLVFYLIVWVKLTFQILEIKLFTVIFSFKFSPFNVISNSYLHVRILFFPMLEVKSVHWCACMPRNESFTNVCACVWKN